MELDQQRNNKTHYNDPKKQPNRTSRNVEIDKKYFILVDFLVSICQKLLELDKHDLIVNSQIVISFIIKVGWIDQIPFVHIDLLNQHLVDTNLPFLQIIVPDIIVMINQYQSIIVHHLIHHQLFELLFISYQILQIIIGLVYNVQLVLQSFTSWSSHEVPVYLVVVVCIHKCFLVRPYSTV